MGNGRCERTIGKQAIKRTTKTTNMESETKNDKLKRKANDVKLN